MRHALRQITKCGHPSNAEVTRHSLDFSQSQTEDRDASRANHHRTPAPPQIAAAQLDDIIDQSYRSHLNFRLH
jgi:hypothetical protein